MKTAIYKDFMFEAAHKLPNVPAGHKCGRLHGHSYKVRIHLEGIVNKDTGWFIDFSDVKSIFKPIYDQLDHNYLNDIKGLENPTAEVISKWIWEELKPSLSELSAIELMETCTCGVVYKGN
ncbi:6-carboxytetrahydropterin synthase QueD [Colwellia polaris]|jgi:6-pyruvoyltetrahydropterin/6-carboxytetrahydropterin synthase|uniref:6-carboxytetrahydropterin synthase QueD n=1 Tax=Colwellia polaris TaxID=326537 RepID=UPI000A173A5C|nr:6-carboxytetrahydropterin synthase QueD [Colwellia polaris]|tara:strand:+ start:107 stop:469 length:363 start_codon:yes stop_codon:yes gene_type:complete